MRISDWSSDVCSSDLWWPRLEYLDRRRDQVDAVPPSLQAAPDGGRSRYKTCQGTVFEAGLHRLARLPVDPLRTVGPERPRRLPTLLSDRKCDLPARRIQHATVPQYGAKAEPRKPAHKYFTSHLHLWHNKNPKHKQEDSPPA